MTLALRRIDVDLQEADASHGIIKASALASVDTARSTIARAQLQADRLLEEAREHARAELQHQRHELETQMWRHAADYAQSLQSEWDRSLQVLEDRMLALLARAMRRLIQEVPAEERLRVCLKQLIDEAGTPDTGVLLVGASMQAAIHAMEGRLPWPVKISDELPEGTVRLAAEHGRWECAFDTAVGRLGEALHQAQDHQPEHDDV